MDFYLCIGGYWDGKRLSEAMSRAAPFIELPSAVKGAIQKETYRREEFQTPGGRHPVYIHSSLTMGDAMTKLLAHYAPPNVPEERGDYER